VFFYPDASWCPGWKRNWAEVLKLKEAIQLSSLFWVEYCLGGSRRKPSVGGILHPDWTVEVGLGEDWARRSTEMEYRKARVEGAEVERRGCWE
jgi:hypothetical protein